MSIGRTPRATPFLNLALALVAFGAGAAAVIIVTLLAVHGLD
jgi:hypothetical protein